MAKKIIGLTGEIGSGKDTFCEYVKSNYPNVFVIRFSDALTDVLKIFFDSVKREDQQWLAPMLRQRFGSDILAKALVKKANSVSKGIVILNGVRDEEEAEAIKKAGGKIIYITAGQKTRWERVRIRNEKADDNAPFEKFQELEKALTEVQIPALGKAAEFKLDNNGTKDEFHAQIKSLLNDKK